MQKQQEREAIANLSLAARKHPVYISREEKIVYKIAGVSEQNKCLILENLLKQSHGLSQAELLTLSLLVEYKANSEASGRSKLFLLGELKKEGFIKTDDEIVKPGSLYKITPQGAHLYSQILSKKSPEKVYSAAKESKRRFDEKNPSTMEIKRTKPNQYPGYASFSLMTNAKTSTNFDRLAAENSKAIKSPISG